MYSMAYCTIPHSLAELGPSTKDGYLDFWLTRLPLLLELIASQVCLVEIQDGIPLTKLIITDHPTPKFGEALRNQVEERLTFFETGAAPSKNADAMRKVLDQLDLDDDEDDEMEVDGNATLPLIVPSPVKKKDKKKKRKSDAMDVDDEEEEEQPVKKKRSKEEKEARKKEKKQKKAEDGEVSQVTSLLISSNESLFQKKVKKDKEKKKKKSKDVDQDSD